MKPFHAIAFLIAVKLIIPDSLQAQEEMSAEYQEYLREIVVALQLGSIEALDDVFYRRSEVRHECLSCWRYPFLTTHIRDYSGDREFSDWYERYVGPTDSGSIIQIGSLIDIEPECAIFQVDLEALREQQSAAISRVCFETPRSGDPIPNFDITQWTIRPPPDPPCSAKVSADGEVTVGGLRQVFALTGEGGFPGVVRTWPHPTESDRVLVAGFSDTDEGSGVDTIWSTGCDPTASSEVFFQLDGANFAHAEFHTAPYYEEMRLDFRSFFTSVHGVGVLDGTSAIRYATCAELDSWHCDDTPLRTDFVAGASPDFLTLEILRGDDCDGDGDGGDWSLVPLRVSLDPVGVPLGPPYQPVPVFSVSMDVDGVFWLASDQIYRSSDLGESFVPVVRFDDTGYPNASCQGSVFSVQTDSIRAGHFLAYRGDIAGSSCPQEVYRSYDHGETWQLINTDFDSGEHIRGVGLMDGSVDHVRIWSALDGVLRVRQLGPEPGDHSWELIAELSIEDTDTEDGIVRAWNWHHLVPDVPPIALVPIAIDHDVSVVPEPLISITSNGARFRATADGLFRTYDGLGWTRIFPSSQDEL